MEVGPHTCPHCQTTFRKVRTLNLHIREDHGEDGLHQKNVHDQDEGQDNDSDILVGGQSADEEGDRSLWESTEESTDPIEITPMVSDETVERSENIGEAGDDSRAITEEKEEDIGEIREHAQDEVEEPVLIEDDSEDERELNISRDQTFPILSKEAISELLQKSSYFQDKPSIIKPFEPSFKNFDILDPSLPSGFLVWEQHRPNGKHKDREFLSPDGFFVLRSKLAVAEYTKMILSQDHVNDRSGDRVKRRSVRLGRKRKGSPEKDGGKVRRVSSFKATLRARLSSSQFNSRARDDELEVLSTSLSTIPSTTKISFAPAISRRGLTITPLPPVRSNKRKKIKCCGFLFITKAGFENHRRKKHSDREVTLEQDNSGQDEISKKRTEDGVESGERCEECEEDFYWPDEDHVCHYTRTNTRPNTDRVIVQRLYRGYFFFSAD